MKLELTPFTYKFPDNGHCLFLKQSVTLNSHGCYLISGPSGVGKSTFLKILKGFHPEFLEGEINSDTELKSFENSFYLFQNPFTQVIQRSPFLEFLFSMENREFKNEDIFHQFHLLKKFQLEEVVKRKDTSLLSHGECQKLLLLSMIAARPAWIFLDEPTAFIDPSMRQEIYQMIAYEKKQLGFLVVDHHLDEIHDVCDGFFELSLAENGTDVEIHFFENFHKRPIQKNTNIDIKSIEKFKFQPKFNLVMNNVELFYEDKKSLFKKINLEIKPSTVTTFVGRSGLGKSTLLKAILGEHKGVRGEILLYDDDKIIPTKKRYQHIGFLFQNPENHFFFDTVEEELSMTGVNKDEYWDLLTNLKLNKCLHLNPFFLSEGQKRRLSFLLVLLQNKEILLLDEPTFGQDVEQVEIISECINLARKLGRIVILVSHDPTFYTPISDVVVALEDFLV